MIAPFLYYPDFPFFCARTTYYPLNDLIINLLYFPYSGFTFRNLEHAKCSLEHLIRFGSTKLADFSPQREAFNPNILLFISV